MISISVVILLVLAIAVRYGYRHYRVSPIKNGIQKALAKDAAYTELILKVEAEPSSISYQEFFDLCDKSIDARTVLIIEVQGLYPEFHYHLKDKVIEFLKDETALIRAKKAVYRKQITFSALTDNRMGVSTIAQLVEPADNLADSALEFSKTYGAGLNKETALAQEMENERLLFTRILKKYEESNLKAATKHKNTASAVRALALAEAEKMDKEMTVKNALAKGQRCDDKYAEEHLSDYGSVGFILQVGQSEVLVGNRWVLRDIGSKQLIDSYVQCFLTKGTMNRVFINYRDPQTNRIVATGTPYGLVIK